MAVVDLVGRYSTPFDRTMAGVSLAASVFNVTIAPNYGSTVRNSEHLVGNFSDDERFAYNTLDDLAAKAAQGADNAPNPVPRVNPRELNPSHKIAKSPGEMEALKDSIRKKGFVHEADEPVAYVVVNGKKYIVDGHHRVRAAKELGITEIPAIEVQLSYKGYRTINDLFNWDW